MIAFLLGFISLVLSSPAAAAAQRQGAFDHSAFEQLPQQVSDDGLVDAVGPARDLLDSGVFDIPCNDYNWALNARCPLTRSHGVLG